MDFEFECQFAYITNDGEQQQQQTTAEGNARAGDGSGGGGGIEANEAKRLKQEWTMAMEQQARLYMYLEFVDLIVNWYNIVLFFGRDTSRAQSTLHFYYRSKSLYTLHNCRKCLYVIA